jgi:dTDP-4-dehydrorhamnose reductase
MKTKYSVQHDAFESYSVIYTETGKKISEGMPFAGTALNLLFQLNNGIIQPEDVEVFRSHDMDTPLGVDKQRILVLGSPNGFLAKAFQDEGYELFGRINNLDCDSTSFKSVLANKLFQSEYSAVINCIGNADTRFCESNFAEANKINGGIPGQISQICKDANIKFVQISTGCLYDESATPQRETDFIVAHCNYVVTKWTGEQYLNENDLIIRPRLLYGDFECFDKDGNIRRNNLLVKIKAFNKFTRALNSYTSVHTIVEACKALIDQNCSGIFNVADRGYMSMSEIADLCGIEHQLINIEEIRKKDNIYLVNSTMDITKLMMYYEPPMLADELKRCWKEIQ